MKIESFIITITILVLIALGGIAQMNTINYEKQLQINNLSTEVTLLDQQIHYLKLPSLPYASPLKDYRLSSYTGYRTDPMGGEEENLHKGIDLIAPEGSEVYCILDGVVKAHWPAPDSFYKGHPVFGGLIIIKHSNGFFSLYGHLKETFVHQGDYIKRGDVIGLLGSTGISTGPHLHFEVVIDPFKYLEER